MQLAGLILLAYTTGSMPFGLLLTRRLEDVDVRTAGSGNIGATNVRRLAGNGRGALTLAGDMLKGALPVLLARILIEPAAAGIPVSLVALAAIAGHLFPIFTRLRNGGKGVATTAGCFSVMAPAATAIAGGMFIILTGLTRRVSVGSLAAAAVLPAAVWLTTASVTLSGCALLAALLIFLRHADNIGRLFQGREDRL